MPQSLGIHLGTATLSVALRDHRRLQPMAVEGQVLHPTPIPVYGDLAAAPEMVVDPDQARDYHRCVFGWLMTMGSTVPLMRARHRVITARDVCTDVLAWIRRDLEQQLGASVREWPLGLVVPNPHCWEPTRRNAYLSAAREAGFGPVRLLSPAAAVATYFDTKRAFPARRGILVLDAGNRALELTLLISWGEGRFELGAPVRQMRCLGGRAVLAQLAQVLRMRGWISSKDATFDAAKDRSGALNFDSESRVLESLHRTLARDGKVDLAIPEGATLAKIAADPSEVRGSYKMRRLTSRDLAKMLKPDYQELFQNIDELCQEVHIAPTDLAGVCCCGGGFHSGLLLELLQRKRLPTLPASGYRRNKPLQPDLVAVYGATVAASNPLPSSPAGGDPSRTAWSRMAFGMPPNSAKPLDGSRRLQLVLGLAGRPEEEIDLCHDLLRFSAEYATGYRAAYDSTLDRFVLAADLAQDAPEDQVNQRSALMRRGVWQITNVGTVPTLSLGRVRSEHWKTVRETARRSHIGSEEHDPVDARDEGGTLAWRTSHRTLLTIHALSYFVRFRKPLSGPIHSRSASELLRLNAHLNHIKIGLDQDRNMVLQGELLVREISRQTVRQMIEHLESAARGLARRLPALGVTESRLFVGGK